MALGTDVDAQWKMHIGAMWKWNIFFYLDKVTTVFNTTRLPDKDFINIAPNTTQYFSYHIEHGCDNFDDCAGVFAEKKMIKMNEKT